MNSIMETVNEVCISARQSTKTGVSFQKLISAVRKEFKLHDIPLKIYTKKDKHLSSEVFYATGYYDPTNDEEGDCPIELILTHNFPNDTVWYPTHATQVLIQIFDTVVHELKHQRQYKRRNYKPGLDREPGHKQYLSDPDEIDAYSISIATELCRSLGRARALKYLSNSTTLSRYKLAGSYVSPSLSMYKGEFPKPNDPIIRALLKKVYVRLKKVDADCIFM